MENIAFVGLGGYGNKLIDYLQEQKEFALDFIAVNEDSVGLGKTKATKKIQLEEDVESNLQLITSAVGTYDTLFLAAGFGGSIEKTYIMPLLKWAKEQHIDVIVLGTLPFKWEGALRCKEAQLNATTIAQVIKTAAFVDNNDLSLYIKKAKVQIELAKAFGLIDVIFCNIVEEVLNIPIFDEQHIATIIKRNTDTTEQILGV